MAPERLSHGCKTVILMYVNPSLNVYASRCGDNCVPSIIRLSERVDVTITLHHLMELPEKFEGIMMDSGLRVHGHRDFFFEYERLIGKM